jgi:hypothetical protein
MPRVLNGNSREQWQKKITPRLRCGERPRTGSLSMGGMQLLFAAESNALISVWEEFSLESQVGAAGAFDGSVTMEAHHVFRNMSTPRTGGLRPVKHAVPLNEPHVLQLG